MNKRTATTLYVVLILFVILSLIYIIYYMQTNVEAFIKNPLVYGASKIGNVHCSCSQLKDDGNLVWFSFNDTSMGDELGLRIK